MRHGISSLLHLCAKSGDLRRGLRLHAAVITSGQASDVILSNHLINLYARCGRISIAHHVFGGMPERNMVSWSLIISGCDRAGRAPEAIALFTELPCSANEFIYAGAISACAHLLDLQAGLQIHSRVLRTGHGAVSFVSNSLISFYMKCSRPVDAMQIFCNLPAPNLVAYNTMIAGLADNSQFQQSLNLFRVMNRRGLVADHFSLVALLGAIQEEDEASSLSLTSCFLIHCLAIKLGLDRSAFVGNAILAVYSKQGAPEEAESVFLFIEGKDTISYNTYMACCSRHGDHAGALSVFRGMKEADGFSFSCVLAAAAGLASVNHGKQVHARVLRAGAPYEDVAVQNALMNVYVKCGEIGCAETIFRGISEKNLVSWNTMIAGCGYHGKGRRALELLKEMAEEGLHPDSCTLSGVLAACSHAGMVEEGRAIVDAMGSRLGAEHLSAIVDLLGRAGRLEEAESYLKEGVLGEDWVVWGSLLSSCRLHGDMAAGRRVVERLMELQPASSSPYVLMASLYALSGRWGEAAGVRQLLKGSGLKKEPGHSLIEVDGVLDRFLVGDFSHPRFRDIKDTLDSLNQIARKP
ncbi:pentatricopeptide repeat-containing protein At3g53360, mitochondrial-like [Wolffia australiana]